MRYITWRTLARATGLLTLLLLAACGGDNKFTNPGFGGENPSSGTVSGQVTAAGAGVGGVRIILVDRDSTLTDGQGNYEFGDVPSGTYTVSIRVPDNYSLGVGENSSKTVDVAGGGVATANWTLQQDADGAMALIAGPGRIAAWRP